MVQESHAAIFYNVEPIYVIFEAQPIQNLNSESINSIKMILVRKFPIISDIYFWKFQFDVVCF